MYTDVNKYIVILVSEECYDIFDKCLGKNGPLLTGKNSCAKSFFFIRIFMTMVVRVVVEHAKL